MRRQVLAALLGLLAFVAFVVNRRGAGSQPCVEGDEFPQPPCIRIPDWLEYLALVVLAACLASLLFLAVRELRSRGTTRRQ